MAGSENHEGMNISDLVDLYWRKVYKLCLFYLRNAQDAEDATQLVFEKALKKSSAFQGLSDPFTWLYRIAVNTALNMLKRRKIIRWLSLDMIGESQPEAGEDPSQRVEVREEERERQKKLAAGISRMSGREKTAFYLFYYDQIPQKKIAEILDTSVSAVESLVHKAVKKIRLA